MYHRYDGGGMVIDGPSVLIRKNFAEKYSFSANYYVDSVSSASIDVLTLGASAYSEERIETSGDFTLLHEKSLINIGYTKSDENDYRASSFRIDLSQDFFGDMSTLSIGYSQGDDDISKTGDALFADTLTTKQYRAGFSQILTRHLIANINYESIISQGYLQNPYRFILIDDPGTPGVYQIDEEVYPNTRNSDALSFKLSYHLPWSAAIKSRLGYYSDSWGIDALSLALDYSQKLRSKWIVDFRVRQYEQSAADFYSNTFSPESAKQNFVGRDKELSEFTSLSAGVGASYEWNFRRGIDKARVNIQYDYLFFDYDNFREVTTETTAAFGKGQEPLYDFDAYTLRVFFSVWY